MIDGNMPSAADFLDMHFDVVADDERKQQRRKSRWSWLLGKLSGSQSTKGQQPMHAFNLRRRTGSCDSMTTQDDPDDCMPAGADASPATLGRPRMKLASRKRQNPLFDGFGGGCGTTDSPDQPQNPLFVDNCIEDDRDRNNGGGASGASGDWDDVENVNRNANANAGRRLGNGYIVNHATFKKKKKVSVFAILIVALEERGQALLSKGARAVSLLRAARVEGLRCLVFSQSTVNRNVMQ